MNARSPRGRTAAVRIASVLLAIVCLILVLLVRSNPGSNPYSYAPYAFYMLTPDDVTETESGSYAGITRTYTFTIPEDDTRLRHGARLCFFLRHTIADITLDGEPTYSSGEYDTPHIGKTPGLYWLTAAMRSDYAGKELKIALTPVYKGIDIGEPLFLLIDHEQLLARIVQPEDAFALTVGAGTLIAGIFLAVLSLFLRIDPADRLKLRSLGFLAAAASLHVLTRLPAMLLALDVYGLQKFLWYLGAAALLLTHVLALRFIGSQSENRAVSDAASLACIAAAFILLILQFTNISDLYPLLPWYALFGAVLQTVVIAAQKLNVRTLLWLLPFPVMTAADLILFRVTGSERKCIALMLWLTVNLCLRAAGFVSEAFAKERKLREKEEELYETRIRTMIQQIRPHFIYNTLSSIYVLCKNHSPRTLQVLEDFMDYLQANFTAVAADKPIPFADELKHTKAYLAVESARRDELLNVTYDTPHTDFHLPALTLQPIVENAVKHGSGNERFRLEILIRTEKTADGSEITVTDNGPGFAAQPDAQPDAKETHVGLANVRERLELMCGGSLSIDSGPEGGTAVTIRVPEKRS